MKTKVAVLYQANQPLRIEELEVPGLKRGQVLVKIAYSGVCHSQLNEIRGRKGEDKWLPHTLGHEASGEVVAVDNSVKKVKAGDRVVLTWIKASGLNAEQIYYYGNGKIINSGPISTFSHYAIVSENRLVRLEKNIPMDVAALLGCVVPTGVGVILNTLKAKPENTIAIIGVGGVGMSAVIGAKIAECRKIIAVDIVDWKLDLAMELGATDVINAKDHDLYSAIMKISEGKGVDFVVEAAGLQETMETALRLVHDRGTVVIAGNLAQGKKIAIDPFELIKGKRIIGTWGGDTNPDKDIPLYIEKIAAGSIELDKLISHRFKLEDINQAFAELEKGNVSRALIDFSQ